MTAKSDARGGTLQFHLGFVRSAAWGAAVLLLWTLALGGCQLMPETRPSWQTPPLLAPPSSGVDFQANQHLTLERGESNYQFLAILSVTPENIRLSALGPLGQRLSDIQFDGQNLSVVNNPRVDLSLPENWVLAQMQLAYWPLDALRGAYSSPWQIRVMDHKRVLYLGREKLVTVSYSQPDEDTIQRTGDERSGMRIPATTTRLVITHHRLGLKVSVTTLKVWSSED